MPRSGFGAHQMLRPALLVTKTISSSTMCSSSLKQSDPEANRGNNGG
jgi:hypothetical protein